MNADRIETGAEAMVRERVAQSGSSFFWAMRLLPSERREAMYAIYAFCREVDDIADSEAPRTDRLIRLAEWRGEIGRLYGGMPSHPISRALAGPVRAFGLARVDFEAIIDGMEMDAAADLRAPSLAELDLYCDRVASAVGRLSVRVFGVEGDDGPKLANALGRALQLTNILRDIAEDGARGRLYLPAELIAKHAIADMRIESVLAHPKLPLVARDLAEIAGRHFEAAETLMRGLPRERIRPALIMGALYKRILSLLVERDWRDLERPVRITRPVKLWVALRAGYL
jgi:presqualene diphosphate synthase